MVADSTNGFTSVEKTALPDSTDNSDGNCPSHAVNNQYGPAHATEPGPAPDGGIQAWLQVLVGHLAVFNSWGYIISFGIFQPWYEETLSQQPSTIAWIGSVQICLLFLFGTLSGRAFDAGYLRTDYFIGSLLQVLGIFTTSVSTTYWQLFLAQGVCQGLGSGMMFAPTIAHISTYFTKKRVMALSLAACGGATGGMVFPLMAQQLHPRIGFGWTLRCMGFVMLFNALVLVGLAKQRHLPRRAGPLVDLSAFKELPYLFFAVSMFFTLWATYFVYVYARAYALDALSASQSTSFIILIVINVVGIPGRMIPAYLADRFFGAPRVFIAVILGAVVCIFGWYGVQSMPEFYAWVSILGFFTAGIQSLFPATLSGLTKDVNKAGIRIGMIFTISSIPALTGPPLAGKLIQAANGKYVAAQMWGGACLLLGDCLLVAAWWMTLPKRKPLPSDDANDREQ